MSNPGGGPPYPGEGQDPWARPNPSYGPPDPGGQPTYIPPPYGQPAAPESGGQPTYVPPAPPPFGGPTNPYNQPPAFGQQPPPYGQQPPPYGQPQFGQPPYGPPPYGQFNPAPAGGGSNRTPLIIGLVVVFVLVVAGITAYAVTRNPANHNAANGTPSPTSSFGFGAPLSTDSAPGTAAPTDTGAPTDSGVPTDGEPDPTGSAPPPNGPSLVSSKATAARYFNDLNTQNKSDAATLVCAEGQATFQKSLTEPDNDFDFSWTDIAFSAVGAVDDDTTALNYSATITENGNAQDINVILYFVDENGAKLCGEKAG